MPVIDSLQTLLVEELRDIYDAEKRLTKAIPKMAKASTNPELRSALDEHLDQTREHVSRLEDAFSLLDEPAKGKPCAGMKGLLEEGDEHVGEEYGDDGLRDAVIIGSAQRVEHYEMAAYGVAIAHARLLSQDEIVGLLEETLEEEKAADQKLSEIAETVVNLSAASADEDTDEEIDEEAVSRPRTARRASASTARSKAADAAKSSKRRRSKRR